MNQDRGNFIRLRFNGSYFSLFLKGEHLTPALSIFTWHIHSYGEAKYPYFADRPDLILIFVRGSWYLDVIWWMPSSSWNGQSLGQCHDVLNIRIKHAPFKEKSQKPKYTIKQINFKILLKWNFGSWTWRGRFRQFLKCNFSFSV